jgi:hypothetical protein
MTFGLANRSKMHAMGVADDAVYTPRWRVIAACVVAKGKDGRNQHCYVGDTLDWLSDDEAARFMRFKLVEPIDADAQDATATDAPAEQVDDAPADSDAVDECIATLARLHVPTTAGAPACRTALRGNQYRYSNAVVAAAVKRRKGLSAAATDAEDFETVVL